eukprot:NODE_126_length_17250_cov_2.558743.p10 type:complete len:243 gc:universal NODE_126_length_17250_cov_2.558743:1191-463(-)
MFSKLHSKILLGKLPTFMTGNLTTNYKPDPHALDVYAQFDQPVSSTKYEDIPDPFQLVDYEIKDIQNLPSDDAAIRYNNLLENDWGNPIKWSKEASGRPDGILPFGAYDLGKIEGQHPAIWRNGEFKYVTDKDPYGNYDDPWDRRNIGDPLHEEDDILGSFTPTMYHKENTGKSTWDYAKGLLKAAFSIGLIYWVFDQHKYIRGFNGMDYPVMSKMYAKGYDGIYNVQLDGVEYAKRILEDK